VRTLAEFFDHVDAIAAAAPRLSEAESAKYEKICARLHRANTERRRAEKRGDAKKLAAATRAISRARADRDAIVAPHVSHLPAPTRILCNDEYPWSGPSGSGIHRISYEMILDCKDLSGPDYRTVRVLKDEGGPPTNARSAPTSMGVAWHAVPSLIVVVDEEKLS